MINSKISGGAMSIEIKSSRLHLKLLEQSHLPYLTELNKDPKVRRFYPNGIQTQAQTEMRMKELMAFYDQNGLPGFAIFDLHMHEFVGRCGFALIESGEIEAGYLLRTSCWGLGYATEVLGALLEWGQNNIDAEYIIAFAPVDHAASQRVMQKCGMVHYKNDLSHEVECCFYRISNAK